MSVMRNVFAAVTLAFAAAIAWAFGANGLLDVMVSSLTAARAGLTESGDIARVDEAKALLEATPADTQATTASIKALRKSLKKLGPLAGDPSIAPAVTQTVGLVPAFLVPHAGAALQAVNRAPLTKRPGLIGKLGATQGKIEAAAGNSSLTPDQKLKAFEKASKAHDKIIRQFGS